MTRAYGRARKGKRAIDYCPQARWNTTTLVAAINCKCTIAPMVLDGPMDTIAFIAYVNQMLIPALEPGTIVVMDNLSVHKSPAVKKLFQDAGMELRYLPPYSPDLNPIEMVWSKVKSIIRGVKPRSEEALWHSTAIALSAITRTDIQGYFFHCGVCINY